MKVFDCQDMPDDIKNTFFDQNECGNDCLVYYTVNWLRQAQQEDAEMELNYELSEEERLEEKDEILKAKMLDDWFIENGALNDEQIIVSHWW